MTELRCRVLNWEKTEEHQLTADALGGRYLIFRYNQKLNVVWTFGTSHRHIHDLASGLTSITDAQVIAQNDFQNLIEDGLFTN